MPGSGSEYPALLQQLQRQEQILQSVLQQSLQRPHQQQTQTGVAAYCRVNVRKRRIVTPIDPTKWPERKGVVYSVSCCLYSSRSSSLYFSICPSQYKCISLYIYSSHLCRVIGFELMKYMFLRWEIIKSCIRSKYFLFLFIHFTYKLYVVHAPISLCVICVRHRNCA